MKGEQDGQRTKKVTKNLGPGRIVVVFSVAGLQWLVAVRGLPISRGKLYPGYRPFRRLRFAVGGNRRERRAPMSELPALRMPH